MTGPAEKVHLAEVHDGDTLRLTDGRKVRLIGVNTPELAIKQQPAEPLAAAARDLAATFFTASKILYLQLGVEKQDHYGRWLAYVYDEQGRSLEAELLAKGLALQVTLAPNVDRWQCLQSAEQIAQQQRLGVWGHPYFKVKQLAFLGERDSGFRRITGNVSRVVLGAKEWWIEFDKQFAVRIPEQGKTYFSPEKLLKLNGRAVEVRGWLANRSNSKAVKTNGFSPWLMTISHPNALKEL